MGAASSRDLKELFRKSWIRGWKPLPLFIALMNKFIHQIGNQDGHLTDFIPHSRPTLGPKEIKAASDVIASGQIAQAKVVQAFESAFARKLGVKYALTTSSGTAALHLALLSLSIGTDDEVIIPSYVCTALLNAVRYVGAQPVLAEINPDTFNLDPDDVKKRLSRRTKALIVPHLFGLAADLDGLLNLNVPIIEDCAQSTGAVYRQQALGTFGHAAIFSFYATKVMTCGEGGMIVSNSKKSIDRIKDLKDYDKKDAYKTRYNYKMTDIQASIGLAQLSRLDSFIQRRRSIARSYIEAFKSLGLKLGPHDPEHIYYRFIIKLKTDSSPLISELLQKGIGCDRAIYLPLHQLLKLKGYPITEEVWQKSLSLPIYPSLTQKEVDRVIEAFLDAHGHESL